MNLPKNLDLAAAWAQAYGHPAVRSILGDSFHPGGLVTTRRLASLASITSESRVLDVGCGLGATSLFLAERFGCTVHGITLEAEGVTSGSVRATEKGLEHLATFEQADITRWVPAHGSYDNLFMECVLSIIEDKEAALRSAARALTQGGAIGISDFFINGPLPEELNQVLTRLGWLGALRPIGEYHNLLDSQGFRVNHVENAHEALQELMERIKGQLLGAEIVAKLGLLTLGTALLSKTKDLFSRIQEMVLSGTLSYDLIVARQD